MHESPARRRGVAALLPPPGVRRTLLGVGLVSVLLMIAGIACGGDGNSGRADSRDTVSIQTFTPTPPDHTPEALVTREAQQTAWAQTATAQPAVTATPPVAGTRVEGTREPAGPGTPNPEDEIRPPDMFLDTNGGQAQAALGSFNWCEIRLLQCASIQFGYLILEHGSVTWSAGTPGVITTPNASLAPLTAELALYLHDENVVIPVNASGQVIGDKPAFVALTEPAQTFSVSGPDISVTPDVPPGRYVLSVNMNWTLPEGATLPLYTNYAFVVEIL
jgi:hypothetical protein